MKSGTLLIWYIGYNSSMSNSYRPAKFHKINTLKWLFNHACMHLHKLNLAPQKCSATYAVYYINYVCTKYVQHCKSNIAAASLIIYIMYVYVYELQSCLLACMYYAYMCMHACAWPMALHACMQSRTRSENDIARL